MTFRCLDSRSSISRTTDAGRLRFNTSAISTGRPLAVLMKLVILTLLLNLIVQDSFHWKKLENLIGENICNICEMTNLTLPKTSCLQTFRREDATSPISSERSAPIPCWCLWLWWQACQAPVDGIHQLNPRKYAKAYKGV